LGNAAFWRNDLLRAKSLTLAAFDMFQLSNDQLGSALALGTLGFIAARDRDREAAYRYTQRAIDLFDQVGDRYGWSACVNSMAELLRADGKLDEAEALYRKAYDMRVAIGAVDGGAALLNIGLIKLSRRQFAAAQSVYREVRGVAESNGQQLYLGHALIGLLAAASGLADWDNFDGLLPAVKGAIERFPGPSEDAAEALAVAAGMCRVYGQNQRADDAAALAAAQWDGLGMAERARQVRESH
jgi:tetratricopeptide (TPR) repeat protein